MTKNEGINATIKLEHELLAVETEHRVHAMLELVAPTDPSTGLRPPLHVALVLDRSGSMQGPKLETTKSCARYLVRRMAPTDQLALVTFDDQVELRAPLTTIGDGADALELAVATVFAGGRTNLSGGWLKGLEALHAPKLPVPGDEDATRTLLLLTDGQANVGVTDPQSLVEMARSAHASGVRSTTIGYGADFAEELLTAMADAGGGSACFAESPEAAPGIFAQEFDDLVKLVAQNVSVEIRPSADVQVLQVLNEYPCVPVPGGVQMQLGDAYGQERRRVVFELLVPSMASLGVTKVADVVLRYVSVGATVAAHEVTVPIVVNAVNADEAAAEGGDHEVAEEILVLKANRAQAEARKHADEGRFDEARTVLGESVEDLRAMSASSTRPDALLQHAAQIDEYVASMESGEYDQTTSKRMHYDWHQRRRRRES